MWSCFPPSWLRHCIVIESYLELITLKKKIYFINTGKSTCIWKKSSVHICVSVRGPNKTKDAAAPLNDFDFCDGDFRASRSRGQSKDPLALSSLSFAKASSDPHVRSPKPFLGLHAAIFFHERGPEPRTDVVMGVDTESARPAYSQAAAGRIGASCPKGGNVPTPFKLPGPPAQASLTLRGSVKQDLLPPILWKQKKQTSILSKTKRSFYSWCAFFFLPISVLLF